MARDGPKLSSSAWYSGSSRSDGWSARRDKRSDRCTCDWTHRSSDWPAPGQSGGISPMCKSRIRSSACCLLSDAMSKTLQPESMPGHYRCDKPYFYLHYANPADHIAPCLFILNQAPSGWVMTDSKGGVISLIAPFALFFFIFTNCLNFTVSTFRSTETQYPTRQSWG